MRQVREVLRQKWGMGRTLRQIARSCGVSRDTVTEYVRRAEAAGLSWPLPADLDDAALDARLFPGNPAHLNQRPEPDFPWILKELRRKHVTLWLLWTEYKRQHPDGYQYSHFCERYRQWVKTTEITFRQVHKAGEKVFLDFAGDTVEVVDPFTGELFQGHIFVAVQGASNYLYTEAFPGEGMCAWVMGVRHALEFFKGVPRALVPDNPKATVVRPCRFEPELNRVFQEMAAHYGTAVLPAPPRMPRAKAKVEAGVKFVETRILAALRDRTFFGLTELNRAVREAMVELNEEPFKKLEGNRRSCFEELDRPALLPLPALPYEFAVWKRARVHIDYHVEVEGNFYSVPYRLAHREVEVRLTARLVEVLFQGKQVAAHQRLWGKGRTSTIPEHLAPAHSKHREWTPERFASWAATIGPSTVKLVHDILESRPHPELGFRSCLGILSLGKRYGPERLEAAAGRALSFRALSYRHIRSILEKGLDQVPAETVSAPAPLQHSNLRGAAYYGGGQVH